MVGLFAVSLLALLFAPLVVLGGKLREANFFTVVINLRPLVHLAHVAERS